MNQRADRGSVIFMASVGGVLWMLVLFIAMLVVTSSPSSNYSPAEQLFLAEIHQQTDFTKWPNDGELVSEGHMVCIILNSNGGDKEALYETRLWGYGPDPMPDWMKAYNSSDQRYELVRIAAHHFCDQYTFYLGGVPE